MNNFHLVLIEIWQVGRICSPPDQSIARMYDLKGIGETLIIEHGEISKCIYQLHGNTPFYWNASAKAKIYSGRGNQRLGHIRKLMETDKNNEIMLYLRVHPELDIMSKCILIGAAIFAVHACGFNEFVVVYMK